MSTDVFQWFLEHYRFPADKREPLRNLTPFTLQELAVGCRQIGRLLTEEELQEAVILVSDVPLDDIFEACLIEAIERVGRRS